MDNTDFNVQPNPCWG